MNEERGKIIAGIIYNKIRSSRHKVSKCIGSLHSSESGSYNVARKNLFSYFFRSELLETPLKVGRQFSNESKKLQVPFKGWHNAVEDISLAADNTYLKEVEINNSSKEKYDYFSFENRYELGPFIHLTETVVKGFYFSRTDIVSVQDEDMRYYGQIKYIILDLKYCKKFANLYWLVPTASSPENGFDPNTFQYGFQDEYYLDMNYMRFEMHAPTPFYRGFIYPPGEDTKLKHPVKYEKKHNRRQEAILLYPPQEN